jgi:hypothetical protein
MIWKSAVNCNKDYKDSNIVILLCPPQKYPCFDAVGHVWWNDLRAMLVVA